MNNGKQISYALGIAHDKYHGYTQFSHSGGDAGYRTWLTVFPDLKTGFIVFSNLADADIYGRTYKMVDFFVPDISGKEKTGDINIDSSKAIVKDEQRIKKLAGDFLGEDGAQFGFVVRDHKLFWERNGNADLLYPGGKDSFYVARSPVVGFVFGTGADRTTIVNEYWPDGKRLLWKYDTLAPKTDAQLQEYTGIYHSAELDCQYGIALKNHALVLSSTKYEDSKLTFAGKNDFFSDNWWMHHLRILRDKANKITGFEINDGRVMHVRFDKVK